MKMKYVNINKKYSLMIPLDILSKMKRNDYKITIPVILARSICIVYNSNICTKINRHCIK